MEIKYICETGFKAAEISGFKKGVPVKLYVHPGPNHLRDVEKAIAQLDAVDFGVSANEPIACA